MRLTDDFSHVEEFTGYMGQIQEYLGKGDGKTLLDIPAGNGKFAEALARNGYKVIAADINKAQQDYVYADMNEILPFDDNMFDCVVCLEGLEHLHQPVKLIRELIRVCKPGGRIVISTPNVTGMFSRLQFLFTGTLYQFSPMGLTQAVPGQKIDLGHMSPLHFWQLRYFFEFYGASQNTVFGDKIKRKIFLPFYLLVAALGGFWLWRLLSDNKKAFFHGKNRQLYRQFYSKDVLFSRSLIMVFDKL